MFRTICIKSKKLDNQKIDIAFLIETMLFYGNVIILAYRDELITLLKYLGEDFLEELIKSGRIDLRIRRDILGSMIFPNDRYNINLFSKNNETIGGILYQSHRAVVNDSKKNSIFEDKFSKFTLPFTYGNEITAQIRNDFDNEDLLKKSLPIYLNARVPNFEIPKDVKIEINKDSSFGPFGAYSVKSNIDLKELNKIHKQNNPKEFHPIDYSGFFLSLAESKGDIFIASQFRSELVTNEIYSKFIELQFIEIIQRRIQSQRNLNLFNEYILKDCHSIGEAFINGIVSKKELLKLFKKADRFRQWLLEVPDNKDIIGEYYNAVTKETFADKLPAKTTRFAIFEGIGIVLDILGAGGIGTAVATGIAAFDEFYLDKLIGGWKPNQFINTTLKPMIKK